MEKRTTRVLWLLVFLLGCGRMSAFNLDSDNVLRKNGDPGSLFGFSLAMHRQLIPEDKRMLLVGAPKANAIRGQKSKVTGGLYNCDMSSTATGCTRVVFDNTEDLTRESKENQWLGVTVNSQGPGGKIVTCAHRYQRRANVNTSLESRDIIGRCYVLSQDLTIDGGSSEDGGNWLFCDNRPRGHEMFGSCQQGLSATFDKDYHYLIFGAPGAYNWRGIVRLEQKNDSLLDLGIFDDGPFEAGDERQKNPDLVPAPANSFLGFSLDSGKALTKMGELIVVAGAPRANYSGAVVLLKSGGLSSNSLLEEYTLEGEGLASSFGYDLTVLDLNRDGWLDIVVGAPQYFEKDGEIGGAVYVYVNKAGKWKDVKPTRIDGTKDSMFGLAVENLGDINQDGYHDFAVGAPYEDGAAGNVYIYHGSATGLSSKKAAQVLSGKPLGVKLFGYSLAGNMDLDKNSYPDLAVGSLSDSVFVFRARPVININKELKFSPEKIDLAKKNCGNNVCLDVEACFSYTASPSSYTPRLSKLSHKRLLFLLINVHCGWCVMLCDFTILQENIKDKLHGIPVDVTVAIQHGQRKRRQSSAPQLPPVMDANIPKSTRSLVNFLKMGCGDDNVCQSNLQLKYRYGHKTDGDNTFTPLELEGGVPVISLSDQKNIILEVKVSNPSGDDAYEAFLNASFPRSLTYSAFSLPPNVNGSSAECELGNPFRRNSETTFYIILDTSGISLNTTEMEIYLQLKTTSEQPNIPPVIAKIKVAIVLQLSVSGQAQPSQVYFTGEVVGEAAMKSESEIGSAIAHQFRVSTGNLLDQKPSDFGTATLNIDWPKLTAQGKWLLYPMKISSTGVDKMDCSPKEEINSLGLVSESHYSAKKKKEREQGTLSRLLDTKKIATLSCNSGAQCVTFTCPLEGLDSNAVITLYSRLWNGTFLEVKRVLRVSVSVAHLHIILVFCLYRVPQVKLTVFPERRTAAYGGGVPWWIIVLSILFGLLLLAMLAFLLWKCGFFKHAKYEDKVPSYTAVRIKREERAIDAAKGNWENLETKPWMTTWHGNEQYS
uniref:Integrin alpha-2 domain-containing protein n=1 Tax=Monopterus albus TaxID=43700 RepID=A0A3Q3KPD0_MONAL